MAAIVNHSVINAWGNGLAVRLTKPVAKAAGLAEETPIRITAQPGRIIIDIQMKQPNLADMLAAFDIKRHSGEVMAFSPVGREQL